MNQDEYDEITRLFSSLRAGPTDEEVDTMLEPVPDEELPALRSEIRQTANRIFDNWRSLESIVQRHEATIQKRWTNKSKLKRRELLLTTWPSMAPEHRPDIVLDNRSSTMADMKEEIKRMLEGGPRQQTMYEGVQREALLMPYINLHDLTKTEPLLLMINARGRRPPHAFASRDLQLSAPKIGMTKWRILDGYTMDFDGRTSGPETYGELQEGEWTTSLDAMGADPRIAGGAINPGDGLWILEIQDRLYKFLLDAAQRILHDIPAGDLTGPEYQIQPEPSLPSANSREDGVISLAITNLEATYSSPGRMDLHRYQSLLTARAHEEEDKLWALREDPGRFTESLVDFIAHRPEYVPDLSGKQHETTTIGGFRKHYGSGMKDLEDVYVMVFLLCNFIDMQFWGELAQEITGLIGLKKQHFDNKNVQPSDPLPQPFAMGLYRLQYNLCKTVEQRISILRMTVYSSPPMRPYMQRTSPDTLDKFAYNAQRSKPPPQHIFDFMTILSRLFDGDTLNIGHIAGVQSLMDQYDKFIVNVPNARQAISPFIAQQMSDLALLSDCLRQIHLFQPWATTLRKEIENSPVQAAIEAEFNEKLDRVRPRFKPGDQIRSMAVTISKSPYPVHKKRTAANVEAMQDAEALLDRMWGTMLQAMVQCNVLLSHSKMVLFLQGRQLQRTPDWVEPAKPTKKTTPQAAFSEGLGQPFGGHGVDDTHKVHVPTKENSKTKTRGTAASRPAASTQVETSEQETQSPTHTIRVDQRAFKVFGTLFHMPSSTSQPGEVSWTDFLHAMRSAGFGIEKLYGSVWQFVPHDVDDSRMAAGMRSILFHEPHPHSKIPFRHARRHGRRLTRAYGWSGETFVKE